jgi:hypothetical protein
VFLDSESLWHNIEILSVTRGTEEMFGPEIKEKIAYWGAKLECPVDEDANYENTYVSGSLLFP